MVKGFLSDVKSDNSSVTELLGVSEMEDYPASRLVFFLWGVP